MKRLVVRLLRRFGIHLGSGYLGTIPQSELAEKVSAFWEDFR